jgi:hypothetical protein
MLGPVSLVHADFLPVYGSPTYNPATGTVYKGAAAGGVNDAGMAVGESESYDANGKGMGTRPVRWDATGGSVLGYLSADANGRTESGAFGINASGTAVGVSQKYDGGSALGSRAVRWDAGSTAATELGNLGATGAGLTAGEAYTLNASGLAVGLMLKYQYVEGSGTVNMGYRAVRWETSGAATELGNIGTNASGYTESQAYAINPTGTMVGYAHKYDANDNLAGLRAVRWNASGAATELGHLGTDSSGTTQAVAVAVNASGTAVGNAWEIIENSVDLRAVRWNATDTAATALDDLDVIHLMGSQAYAINDAGTAVGYSYKSDSDWNLYGERAMRWDASGAATELGNLGADTWGYTDAEARAINASGIAVGWGLKDGVYGDSLAVYWGLDGNAVNLNTLIDPNSGWTLTKAVSISDTSWIVGMGLFDPDGPGGAGSYDRLFLVQIPEPATLALLTLGGLAMLRRRRGF